MASAPRLTWIAPIFGTPGPDILAASVEGQAISGRAGNDVIAANAVGGGFFGNEGRAGRCRAVRAAERLLICIKAVGGSGPYGCSEFNA